MYLIRLLLTLLIVVAAAAEDPAPAAKRAEATQHEQAGMTAMQAANSDPAQSVEAAMQFTAALKLYEALEDFDKCQEMNANIFWCKKRMNLDDLYAYLARKNNDKESTANYEKLVAVADKKVAVDEAQGYFDRAQKFASENPKKYLLIAIRYFEVAERFAGSEVSLKAQKLSLAAQEEHMRTAVPAAVARENIFTRPPADAAPGQVEVPNAADQKAAATQLKTLFKEGNGASKKQKEALARKYLDNAKTGKEDAKTRYALLSQAMDHAVQCGSIYLIAMIADELGREFTGYDALAGKKAALTKIKTQEAAAAALQMIEDPTNKDANLKVGRHLCLVGGQWDAGLPMMAAGSDERLAKVAEMELQKPSGAMQEMELGDLWYDIAIKTNSSLKEPMFARTRLWYKAALANLPDASKRKVEQRLDEIFAISPDPDADYNALTVAQWDRLKAATFEVNCSKQTNDPHVTLKAGQKVRVVPHPTDTWNGVDFFRGEDTVAYTWKGAIDSPMARFEAQNGQGKKSLPMMALACQIDNLPKHPPGLFSGPGKLTLMVNDPWHSASNGVIRVKFLMLDE
jgi:hypothetical protein